MLDRIGKQYGNYQIIRSLGKGGFAEVYLGEHIFLKTYVAIKMLLVQLEDEGVENFLNEARTVAKLNHPNIVQVMDFGVENTIPFLVMNYAPNGSLRDRHPKDIPLQPSLVLYYIKQLASALQYAHDQRLVHRDVKPHNMLLGANNEVLLSDFGLALVDHSTLTRPTQNRAGTPAYMAPEQFLGKSRAASDQYALGVVVYEWLCGQLPFPRGMSEYHHRYTAPPPLREKVPAISPAVEKVVLRALEKDPHQRFASVNDFAAALQEAYSSEPYSLPPYVALAASPLTPLAPSTQLMDEHGVAEVSTSPNGTGLSAQTPIAQTEVVSAHQAEDDDDDTLPASYVKQGKFALQPTPVAFALDTAIPTAPLTEQQNADTFLPTFLAIPRQQANIPLPSTPIPDAFVPGAPVPNTPVPQNAVLGTPLPPFSTLAPGQQQPLQKSKLSRRRAVWLVSSLIVVAIGGGIASFVEHTVTGNSAARGPALTPGATVNLPNQPTTSGSTATPVPVGKLIRTYSAHQGDVKGVAWSPDGTLIASVGGQTVEVWNASTGKDILLPPYSHDTKALKSLSWSPDGRSIASGSEDMMVHVWEVATGSDLSFSPYTKHTKIVRGVAWSPDGQHIASGSEDNTVRVWSATDGSDLPFSPYTGHSNFVITVAWSPDSRQIASASWDKSVQVWDASNGQTFHHLEHSGFVRAVAWSKDGKHIASGGDDWKVYLWDAATGTLLQTYPGHTSSVQAMTWSPNGRYVASASFDKTVRIWDITTGTSVFIYQGHTGEVWSVSWSPDGRYIASGAIGPDDSVQIWQAV